MSFSCGIVGLPNVGKSTLFNAISNKDIANVGNFPFCTIEPNVSTVAIEDERLYKVAAITKSEAVIPCTIDIVDIAGLVKGASQGAGLGNKFLSNIREVDAIIHVVRCFESDDIIHTSNKVDPIDDLEVINTELLIADMEVISKTLENLKKKKQKDSEEQISLLEILKQKVEEGVMLNSLGLSKEDARCVKSLGLLTLKPCIYVANIDENSIQNGNELSKRLEDRVAPSKVVRLSSKLELDISKLALDEKNEMKDLFNIKTSATDQLIKAGYDVLEMITYFTTGPKETRGWSINKGFKAPQAAGVIHTDFEKGFIKAECIGYDDFIRLGGETAAKDAGKLRLEGKEYVVNDADIMHFKFNV